MSKMISTNTAEPSQSMVEEQIGRYKKGYRKRRKDSIKYKTGLGLLCATFLAIFSITSFGTAKRMMSKKLERMKELNQTATKVLEKEKQLNKMMSQELEKEKQLNEMMSQELEKEKELNQTATEVLEKEKEMMSQELEKEKQLNKMMSQELEKEKQLNETVSQKLEKEKHALRTALEKLKCQFLQKDERITHLEDKYESLLQDYKRDNFSYYQSLVSLTEENASLNRALSDG